MAEPIVLVHSPTCGPFSWELVAGELRRADGRSSSRQWRQAKIPPSPSGDNTPAVARKQSPRCRPRQARAVARRSTDATPSSLAQDSSSERPRAATRISSGTQSGKGAVHVRCATLRVWAS